jgi:hypothetical protein
MKGIENSLNKLKLIILVDYSFSKRSEKALLKERRDKKDYRVSGILPASLS